MKITPLDIRNHQFKRTLRGYDIREVDVIKELAAEALEDAAKEIMGLEERLEDSTARLDEQLAKEEILRDTITTAQRMVEDLKSNARKEADLLIAEARLQAEEIVRQAHGRSIAIQDEIFRLKKQRAELEASLRAVIDYHSSTLLLEEHEHKKADEESEKLKFIK